METDNTINIIKTVQSNYDRAKSIKSHIQERFVPALWSSTTLYERSSWLGRLAVWLQRPHERRKEDQRAWDIFKNAVQLLLSDTEGLKKVPFDIGQKLIQEIHEADASIAAAYPTPELDALGEIQKKEAARTQEEIRQLSLLRSFVPKQPIDAATLESILTREKKLTLGALDYLESYLSQHPHIAAPNYIERLNILRQGLAQRKEIHATVVQNSEVGPMLAKASEWSEKTVAKIKAMQAGEAHYVFGSYGTSHISINTILKKLKSMPQEFLNSLPAPIKTVVEQEALPNPETFVNAALNEFMERFRKEAPQLAEFVNPDAIDPFFPNQERILPQTAQRLLPESIATFIESIMQDGILNILSYGISDPSLQTWLQWLATHGKTVLTSQGQEALLNEAENKLQEFTQGKFNGIQEAIDKIFIELTDEARDALPPLFQQILGIEDILNSGPMVYEICKKANGKYSVSIYTVGQSLKFHTFSSGQQIYWPLRLDDVEEQNLTPLFFQRALIYHIFPQCAKTDPLNIQDFYEGPLKLLNGKKIDTSTNYTQHLLNRPGNEWEFAQVFSTQEQTWNQPVGFEIHLEAYLSFCASLLTGPNQTLDIKDPNTARILTHASQDILRQAEKVLQGNQNSERLKRIKATTQEVLEALPNRSTPSEPTVAQFALPPQMRQEIHRILQQHGITASKIENVKSTLVFLFGDEIGPFVDAIAGSFESSLPQEGMAVPEGGTLGQTYKWFYFNLTLKAMKWALIAANLYGVAAHPILILPLSRVVLPYILPAPILDWYYRIEEAIKRALLSLIGKFVLNVIISSEDRKRLEQLSKEWMLQAKQWQDRLTGTGKISFHYTPVAVPAQPEQSDKLIQITSPSKDALFISTKLKRNETHVTPLHLGSASIDAQLLTEQIQKWTASSHNLPEIQRFNLLLHQIHRLPLPQDDIWKHIEQPEACLDALSDLSIQLHDLQATFSKPQLRLQMQPEIVAAMYHVLGAMDQLTRRCPDITLPAPVNAYPLLNWLKTPGVIIDKVETYDYLRHVVDYFFPTLDIKHLPDEQTLNQAAEKTLFTYHFLKDSFKDGDQLLVDFDSNLAEIRYFNDLLKDPQVNQWLERQGVPETAPLKQKYLTLFRYSLAFTKKIENKIPLPYRLLRLQTLLAKQTVFFKTDSSQSAADIKNCTPKNVNAGDISFLTNLFLWLFRKWEIRKGGGLVEAFHPSNGPLGFRFEEKHVEKIYEQNHKKTQTEILSINDLTPFEKLRRMTILEPNDHLLRGLGWFSEHLSYLSFLRELLHYFLFRPGMLEDQLRHSPHVAQALVEFITTVCEYSQSKYDILDYLKMIETGIKLKEYCRRFAPQQLNLFPNFYELLDKVKSALDHSLILAVQAHALAHEPLHGTQDELRFYQSLVKAWFADPSALLKQSKYEHFHPLILNLSHLYMQSLPKIEKYLTEHGKLQSFLNELCNQLGKTIDASETTQWIRVDAHRYQKGQITLDLMQGSIQGPDSYVHSLAYLRSYQNFSRALGPHIDSLVPVKEGHLKTPDGQFEVFLTAVNVHGNEETNRVEIIRTIKGLSYSHEFGHNLRLDAKILKRLGVEKQSDIVIWHKIPKSVPPELVIHTTSNPKELHFLNLDANDPDGFIIKNEQGLTRINLDHIRHNLDPLFRSGFLSQMQCLADPSSQVIRKFTLPAFNLAFEVDPETDIATCVDDPWKGSTLAKEQFHPNLQNFSSYCILENNGAKTVLLPEGRWISSALHPWLKNLGSLSSLLTPLLDSISFTQTPSYFAYYLNARGELSSKDPKAQLYLLTHYLLQGNMKPAARLSKAIETALNQAPAPDDLLEAFLPLMLIPAMTPGISYLRLRLLAALERNRLVQLKPKKDQVTQDTIDKTAALKQILLSLLVIMDYLSFAKQADPYRKLALGHEYFLFHFLFSKLENVFPGFNLALQTENLIGRNEFIAQYLLPNPLKERWKAVQAKFNLKPSRLASIIKWGIEVLKTPISIPQITVDFRQPGQVSTESNLTQEFEQFFFLLFQCISMIIDLPMHLKLLCDKLRTNMLALNCDVPLDPNKINTQTLLKYFYSYYAIARNDNPHPSTDKHSQLINALQQIKGGWDRDSKELIDILLTVALSRGGAPSTNEFRSACLKSEQSWSKLFETLITFKNAQTGVFSLSRFFSEAAVRGLGKNLISNNILGSLLPAEQLIQEQFPDKGSLAQELTRLSARMMAHVGTATITQTANRQIASLSPMLTNVVEKTLSGRHSGPLKMLASFAYYIGGPLLLKKGMTILENYFLRSANPSPIQSAVMGFLPNDRTWRSTLLAGGLTTVANIAIAVATAKIYRQRVNLVEAIPWTLIPHSKNLLPLLFLATKAAKHLPALPQIQLRQPPEETPPSYIPPSYAPLQEIESNVNSLLEDLFSQVFEEVDVKPQAPKEKRVEPFPCSSNDPVMQDTYNETNASIQQYYASKETKKALRVKNLNALLGVLQRLQAFSSSFKKSIKIEKKRLLEAYIAMHGHPHLAGEVRLPDLWKFIKAYDGRSQGGIAQETVQNLELALARYELKKARQHQLDHLLKLFQDIGELKTVWQKPLDQVPDKELSLFEEKLELIADGLKVKTTFEFKTTPIALLRTLLAYQSRARKMIWHRQFQRLNTIVARDRPHIVNEQLMCEGKTSMLTPALVNIKADGKNAVFVTTPKQVSGTLTNVISGLICDIYDQLSHRFYHDRSFNYNQETLEALLVTIKTAREEQEPIFENREDAQTLYAILVEYTYNYIHFEQCRTKQSKACIEMLKEIMALVMDHGVKLPDETHKIYEQREKLHFPLGRPQTIKESYYNVTARCLYYFATHPLVKTLLQTKEVHTLGKALYIQKVLPDIADQMFAYFAISPSDTAKQAEFKAFICNTGQTIPDWMKAHPQWREMSLVKGNLYVLIADHLEDQKRSTVDFGKSLTGTAEYAKPYEGNTKCAEEFDIQDFSESAVRTFLNILSTGLSIGQAQKLVEHLAQKAKSQMQKHQISFAETEVYHQLSHLFPGERLQEIARLPSGSNEWKEVVKQLNSDTKIIFLYTRHFIWKQIKYYVRSVEVDANKFSAMAAEQISGTGSPYNAGTYPTILEMLKDPTTIGEALHIIFNKCPDPDVPVLKNKNPKLRLFEILNLYFKDPHCSALIDGGAILTGEEPEVVARRMLKFATTHRPEIKGIAFFKKDKNNVDQLHMLMKGNTDAVLAETCNLKPEEFLTYFDHSKGFAANVLQKKPGFAVETIGPLHPLYRIMQEVYRELRDNKKESRLSPLCSKPRSKNDQQIRFVTIGEVQHMILGPKATRDPTLRETINYSLFSQAKIVSKDNSDSMRPKMKHVPFARIFPEMIHSNFDNYLKLFREFENQFISEQIDDPAKLYGHVFGKVPTDKALEAYASKVMADLQGSRLSTAQKEQIRKDLESMPKPVLPAEVTVCHDGNPAHLQTHLLDQLGQQLRVQSSQQSQNEYQTYQQQQSQVRTQHKSMDYVEWPWPQALPPASLDWLRISPPQFKTVEAAKTCPFFSLRETLAQSSNPELVKIASAFDDRLWYPNNWLPRWVAPKHTVAEIGSADQRPLFQLLIHLEETPNGLRMLRAAPLSQHDAALWREKLDRAVDQDPDFWRNQRIKTMLWDVPSRVVASGYQPQDLNRFRNNTDIQRAAVALKFLNGDVSYENYPHVLKQWIDENNPKDMIAAFESIHAQRGVGSIFGSIMEDIINNVKGRDNLEGI